MMALENYLDKSDERILQIKLYMHLNKNLQHLSKLMRDNTFLSQTLL